MVAVLEPRPALRPAPRPLARPQLRLLPGGLGAPAEPIAPPRNWPAIAGLVAAIVVAVALALGIGAGAFASLAPPPPSAGAAAAPGAGHGGTVVVQAGDTIWSIARRLQPSGDVRSLVDQLIERNGSAVLHPGDVLVLP